MEVRDDGIYFDVKNGLFGLGFVVLIGLGGSNTFLENNNVFVVETSMYVEGEGIGGFMVFGGDSFGKMDVS